MSSICSVSSARCRARVARSCAAILGEPRCGAGCPLAARVSTARVFSASSATAAAARNSADRIAPSRRRRIRRAAFGVRRAGGEQRSVLTAAPRKDPTSLPMPCAATSAVALTASASRVKPEASSAERAALVTMAASRRRKPESVISSMLRDSRVRAAVALSAAWRCDSSTYWNASASSFSRVSNSFIAARWRSWRASTNPPAPRQPALRSRFAWPDGRARRRRFAARSRLARRPRETAPLARPQVWLTAFSSPPAASIIALSCALRPASSSAARTETSSRRIASSSIPSRSVRRRWAIFSALTPARALASSNARRGLRAPFRAPACGRRRRRAPRKARPVHGARPVPGAANSGNAVSSAAVSRSDTPARWRAVSPGLRASEGKGGRDKREAAA